MVFSTALSQGYLLRKLHPELEPLMKRGGEMGDV